MSQMIRCNDWLILGSIVGFSNSAKTMVAVVFPEKAPHEGIRTWKDAFLWDKKGQLFFFECPEGYVGTVTASPKDCKILDLSLFFSAIATAKSLNTTPKDEPRGAQSVAQDRARIRSRMTVSERSKIIADLGQGTVQPLREDPVWHSPLPKVRSVLAKEIDAFKGRGCFAYAEASSMEDKARWKASKRYSVQSH